MKICGIICEFNPFHNGHAYLLEQAHCLSGCEAIVCVMSGNFTQRGDICVIEKHLRAKHAVLCGADCVLELPAAFAVAPAEIFAKGAVKILSSIPELDTIAFGCESGNAEEFLNAAKLLLNETDEFKNALTAKLDDGESYVKSYAYAFGCAGGDEKLLTTPNNTLGVEYAKAVLRTGKNIKLLPVKRVGADYGDDGLKNNFSSASAIRRNVTSPLIKDNVPKCVYGDLYDFSTQTERYNAYLRLMLSRASAKDLTQVFGCGDGLENALKAAQDLPFDEIIDKATSKRYPSSRIKRILCANFLRLYREDCEKFLNSVLYLSPLAVNKKRADEVFSAMSRSAYPLLTCGSDEKQLNGVAALCKEKDDFSYQQWRQITDCKPENKLILI